MAKHNSTIELDAIDNASGVFGSAASKIQGYTKQMLQEQRATGETALERILKGGPEGLARMVGAGLFVAGAEAASKALEKIGTTMQDVRRQFVEGQQDAGDMFDKLAEGVPVFGDIWKAGRSIREAITGEKLETELLNQEAKLTTQYFNDSWTAAKGLRETLEKIKDEVAAIIEEGREDAETDPLAKKVMHLKAVEAAQEKADEKEREAAKKTTREAFEKKRADAQGLLGNQEEQFRNTYGMSPEDMKDEIANNRGTATFDFKYKQAIADLADLERSKTTMLSRIRQDEARALQQIDDQEAAKKAAREKNLNDGIVAAQKEAGAEYLRGVEKMMEERHKLENDAADQELKDRAEAAKEAMRAEAEAAKEAAKEEVKGEKGAGPGGGHSPEARRAQLASMFNVGHTSGIAAAARENPELEEQREHRKIFKSMVEYLRQIAEGKSHPTMGDAKPRIFPLGQGMQPGTSMGG